MQPGRIGAGARGAVVDIGPPLVLAIAFLGPALGPGALMNLDMIVLPEMAVPSGMWGLGPEFPRRVPLWVPITALSPIVPATTSTKVLLIAVFVIGWCGMVRWSRSLAIRHPEIVAALYILSPFFLTRLGVGHVGMVLAAALVPWVAPHLLAPTRDLRRLFIGAAVLGLCGYSGGVVALVTVIVSLAVTVPRAAQRYLAALGVTLLAQAVWLVPALLVALSISAEPVPASPFGVDVGNNPLQVLSLSAGHGYWNAYFQVGPGGWTSTVVGALLLALAAYGSPRLPPSVRRPLVALGVTTWTIAALSAFSWANAPFDALTRTTAGGVLREPQRFITLHLFWMAPAACLGALRLRARLADRRNARVWADVAPVLPAAAVLVLSTPGLWGLGGNLDARPVPDSWIEARDLIKASPGSTLALPWTQYFNQDLPGGPVRRVLNPAPFLLSGDVISSSDSRLGRNVREAGDPREPVVAGAVQALIEDATPMSPVLERLGVRWILLMTTTPLADRYAPLLDDPGVDVVLERPEVKVLSLRNWRGAAWDRDGSPVALASMGDVVYHLDGSGPGPAVLARAASGGWMLGWRPASATVDGLISVPGTSGRVWNVATPLALANQVGFIISVGWVFVQVRRGQRLVNPPQSG